MKTFRNLTTLVAFSAVLVGCGGSSNNAVLPSLYEGSWTGSWVGAEAGDGGTLTLTVTADGSVSGSMSRNGGLSGTVAGIINNTGHMTATAGFPSSGNFLMNGSVVLSSGELQGGFNYSWLGENYTGTFTETNASGGTTGGAATGG